MATRRVRVGKRQHTWVKWVVALGVLAVLGLAFAASVGIGNWLLRTAEQYPANEQTPAQSLPEDEILPVRVPPIKAQAYRIGDRYSSYTYAGVAHLCAPLRASDGSLAYASDVCAQKGPETEKPDLAAVVQGGCCGDSLCGHRSAAGRLDGGTPL